jgi:IS6 family transposase
VIRRRPAVSASFAGYRFPPDVILLAVRWYLRYSLSYRDVAELLAERGVDVDHVTIYRWVQRFTPLVIEAARPCRHSVGDRWFVDETYVRVAGVWRYVYRAVDQHGQVIDLNVSKRRNVTAAADARSSNGSDGVDSDQRPRVHPELATRPLRTRRTSPP